MRRTMATTGTKNHKAHEVFLDKEEPSIKMKIKKIERHMYTRLSSTVKSNKQERANRKLKTENRLFVFTSE